MTKANVLDLYHGDNRDAVPDFAALKANGIFAIIHKVSQGTKFVDPQYASRKKAALAAGLLWGGYHFLTSADPIEQAKFFLENTEADANTLLAADFEKSAATPALHQLQDFVSYVDQNSPGNVMCVIYSSDLIRETLKPHQGGHRATTMNGAEIFFAQHRLWLAEYGPHANVPWPWSDKSMSQMWATPFLWQYSETGRVNPVVGNVDLNYYPGTANELAANWPNLQSVTKNPAVV